MSTRTSADILAPVPRRWIDTISPVVRAFIGACFVAFSSYATVFLFAEDIKPLLADRMRLGGFPDRYWFGLLLALGFFFGEVLTAERWQRAYRAILIPDTIYTARQMYSWLYAALIVLIPDWLTLVMALGLAGAELFLVAYGAGWAWWRWILVWLLASGIIAAVGILTLAWAVWLMAWTFALFNGYVVARFGEALIFGRRRTFGKGGT